MNGEKIKTDDEKQIKETLERIEIAKKASRRILFL